MKVTLVLTASAFLSSAQIIIEDNVIKCPQPFGSYCVGSSLKTDIIARCDANGIGRRGRCSDNLSGMPPVGNSIALCYQTSDKSGDASCEKNCVVYGSSGSGNNGTFTLPSDVCIPTFTLTSTTLVSTTSSNPPAGGITTSCPEDNHSITLTTEPGISAPPTTTGPPPIGGPGGGPGSSNSTCTHPVCISTPTETLSLPPTWTPTALPIPPNPSATTRVPTVPTAAAPPLANVKQAGAAMVAVGVAVACLL